MLRHLARLRVSLGFAFGLAALWLAQPTPRSLLFGGVVAVAGELIRLWAAGHLEKGREVTASGPYAFTRHPLYLGSSVMGIGLAIASASLIVAAVVVIYLAVTLTAAIRTEEAHLTEKFGAAYPEYPQRAPGQRGPPVQPGASDEEPRISRRDRPGGRFCGARGQNLPATLTPVRSDLYNQCFPAVVHSSLGAPQRGATGELAAPKLDASQ